ncbi:AAA family ATPase [Micromonospora sp. NPDC048986]|uniref:AAA family ATPase n=1 Tax=Micromonospora sp. NPDC048986 TaxID=3155644 RepID=UPI0033F66A89
MALKTRKPTGKIPPPVVLVEGDEGAGKSWSAAILSASDKVGRTFWLQVGTEVTADEYGLIEGVRYEIIEHDGSWRAIYGAVVDAKTEAEQARKRGEKPTVLVIDQMGAIWDLLSEWAYNRAKGSTSNVKKLAADPNAEIDITSNYWNDATARWRKLMTTVLTFPGIVVLLARGRETALIENGKPVNGKKDYRVEGQKGMAFDVPVWVRMTRDGNPVLVKRRSVHNAVLPNQRPRALPGFTLEKFIFETLQYDPATAGDREVVPLAAGDDAPLSVAASVIDLAITSATTERELRAAHGKVKPALDKGDISQAEAATLWALVNDRKPQVAPEVTPNATPNERQPVEAVA